jgi:methionyl-tRNA formyltransferase
MVRRLAAGPVIGTKQDPAKVTKAPKLKKEDGLIDWSKPAEQVVRQVRAMQPWPTAYTWLHHGDKSLRLTVQRAAVTEPDASATGESAVAGASGSVMVAASRLLVTTGSGVVEVLELQPAGKRRMAAADFLRGHALRPGDRFGPEDLA